MSRPMFEQWLQRIGRESPLWVGMASVVNIAGVIPSWRAADFPKDSRSDQEKLRGDWEEIASDFRSSFEKEIAAQNEK